LGGAPAQDGRRHTHVCSRNERSVGSCGGWQHTRNVGALSQTLAAFRAPSRWGAHHRCFTPLREQAKAHPLVVPHDPRVAVLIGQQQKVKSVRWLCLDSRAEMDAHGGGVIAAQGRNCQTLEVILSCPVCCTRSQTHVALAPRNQRRKKWPSRLRSAALRPVRTSSIAWYYVRTRGLQACTHFRIAFAYLV